MAHIGWKLEDILGIGDVIQMSSSPAFKQISKIGSDSSASQVQINVFLILSDQLGLTKHELFYFLGLALVTEGFPEATVCAEQFFSRAAEDAETTAGQLSQVILDSNRI